MTYAAYRTDIRYRYALVLTRNGEERYVEIETDSRSFVNVCQERRRMHPGWAIEDSWEIPPPQPEQPDDGPSLEESFRRFDEIYQRSLAANTVIAAHYRKQAAIA